jgi:hypothetical protein
MHPLLARPKRRAKILHVDHASFWRKGIGSVSLKGKSDAQHVTLSQGRRVYSGV